MSPEGEQQLLALLKRIADSLEGINSDGIVTYPQEADEEDEPTSP